MCGPHRRFAPLLSRTLRRIPQAVSTVATPDEEKKECIDAAIQFQYRKRWALLQQLGSSFLILFI